MTSDAGKGVMMSKEEQVRELASSEGSAVQGHKELAYSCCNVNTAMGTRPFH